MEVIEVACLVVLVILEIVNVLTTESRLTNIHDAIVQLPVFLSKGQPVVLPRENPPRPGQLKIHIPPGLLAIKDELEG